jgi:glc operon protein GlcG
MNKSAFAFVFLTASTFATALMAQTPPAPYGAPISLEQAKKAVDAAEAEARKNNWNVVISVVDAGGHSVYLRRLDSTQTASVGIATGKATSAVALRRPTKALEDALATSPRLLAVDGIMPLEGGLPIVIDGKIVGGIGVSGVTSQQDAQIASAGVAALK